MQYLTYVGIWPSEAYTKLSQLETAFFPVQYRIYISFQKMMSIKEPLGELHTRLAKARRTLCERNEA
jgi:hypothetical protein